MADGGSFRMFFFSNIVGFSVYDCILKMSFVHVIVCWRILTKFDTVYK